MNEPKSMGEYLALSEDEKLRLNGFVRSVNDGALVYIGPTDVAQTPRTDAQIVRMDSKRFPWTGSAWELVALCRQIERELAEMTAERDAAITRCVAMSHEGQEMRARIEELSTALDCALRGGGIE